MVIDEGTSLNTQKSDTYKR